MARKSSTPAQPARFEIYKQADGQFRWRLIASNGRIVADGGESYRRYAGAEAGIRVVVDAVNEARTSTSLPAPQKRPRKARAVDATTAPPRGESSNVTSSDSLATL